MKVTADTNLLVRIVARDDDRQARIAFDFLSAAEQVIIPLPSLCEFVWVLRRFYGFTSDDLDIAVRAVTNPSNVITDRTAVDAGLHMLADNGDFADGAIASFGMAMGADTFVSFDRAAVKKLNRMGIPARDIGVPA